MVIRENEEEDRGGGDSSKNLETLTSTHTGNANDQLGYSDDDATMWEPQSNYPLIR